jgi:hypothetical protein
MPAPIVWSDDQIAEVLRRYLVDNETTYTIADTFGVSAPTIGALLKKQGVELRGHTLIGGYSAEEKQAWVRLYEEGHDVPVIAALRDVPETTIYTTLQLAGVKVRSDAGRQRQYTVNDAYFEVIDTPEKAYWLGFITADGCIYYPLGQRTPQLAVMLSSIDKDHLVKLKEHLAAESPVLVEEKRAHVRITSQQIAEDLKRLGVGPRKSLSVMPAKIAPRLASHYWRGVVDGDGHVRAFRNRHGHPKAVVELYGNPYMTHGFADYVRALHLHSTYARQKRTNVWAVSFRNAAAAAVLRALYNDAPVYLDRKYAAALEALEAQEQKAYHHRGNPKYDELVPEWHRLATEESWTYSAIARHYNCRRQTVGTRLSDYGGKNASLT